MNDTATIEQPAVAAVDDGWEWAIVEIFGHRRHVGRSREEERFGAKMLRIDVPKLGPSKDDVTWSTHFYGGSSIFSYTLTDEKTVMRHAEHAYVPAIPFRDHGPDEDDEPHHDDDDFGEEDEN
ncbi:hypothetical protein H8A97_30415 [Bradyrhizobium sp. Arg62]|uniref:hypothetical protein n=1 Tax=Bradyrhizobium brasilense TaxID=1419277 RepID=UPI001E59A5E3|nr:hypothetical protein [Bradyrhizobium brasilense]MCC8949300.1 hypothetical protein [Bradyrhizobium brasilense]